MTEPQATRTESKLRASIGFTVSGYRRALARVASTAFLGGIGEALFLITITRAAFAITSGRERVGIVSGWFLSVNHTLLLALALVIARVTASGLAAWQAARLSSAVVGRIRHRVAAAFLGASWEVQQRQRAGSLQELLATYSNQAATLMSSLTQGVVSGANLVALLGLAIAVDPAGALVMTISVLGLAALLRPLRRIIKRRARASTLSGMELSTTVNEMSQLGMELHVFDVQDQARDALGVRIEDARRKGRRLQFASMSSSTIYTGLAYLALVIALAVVAASPAASLTSLGAVMLVMLRSLSYGQALQGAYVGVSSSAPALEELQVVLATFESAKRAGGTDHVGSLGQIEARDVTFSYVEGQVVLEHVSFSIEPREIIGIVGPSGGGKSTLVQLLLGLREPQSGALLADGRDIRQFDRTEWARKITFVPQEAHLISGTVADNIRFLRTGVSQADLERAAQLAHVHDEIVSMEDGYERKIGSAEARLSGGQQQRICIARALVEHPDVLILDEPTSALDVRSEHLIRKTLLDLKERMTVIVIAHRLSTLDICDRIMVIQGGQLVGFDAPAQLARSNEFYREALQLSGLR